MTIVPTITTNEATVLVEQQDRVRVSVDALLRRMWAIAAALVVRSAWEWERIQRHIRFQFRTPTVWKEARARVEPPPVETARFGRA